MCTSSAYVSGKHNNLYSNMTHHCNTPCYIIGGKSYMYDWSASVFIEVQRLESSHGVYILISVSS